MHPEVADKELKPYRIARTVGIAYNAQKVNPKFMNKVIHYFESMGKSVHTMGYVDEKEIRLFMPNYKEGYFCLADLDFWGLPKPDKIKRFVSSDYDYMISLDVEGELQVQALMAQCNAKARIGKHLEAFTFAHDFMIKSYAGTAEEFFEDLKKYLK